MACLRLLTLTIITLPLVLGRSLNLPRGALPPSLDPFYQPPTGFGSKAPGTILRQRPIVASFFGLIPDPIQAYQLLYRTTAINGSAIAEVTTVFKPLFAKTDRFVSFQTAYDSSSTTCNPSYNYELGSPQTDLISSAEFLLLEGYLLSGYIVASSDYEGPDAAFGAARLAGMGVLDGMRAVNNFRNTLGLSLNPLIVGVGYSGGSIATGWAASLQPTYAPELHIKGWAMGGTPANLTGTVVYLDDKLASGFIPDAFHGILAPSAYGAQLQPFVNSIITPLGQSKIAYTGTTCAVEDLLNFAEQSVLSTTFQALGPSLLYSPPFTPVLGQLTMGAYRNETPTAPVYIYHSQLDEIIPYADVSTLVNTWCNYGASVQFSTINGGGHITGEIVGYPGSFQFVQAAFAGTVASGCSRSTQLGGTLNPFALGLDLEPVLFDLIDVLAMAGNGDANIIADLSTLQKTFI